MSNRPSVNSFQIWDYAETKSSVGTLYELAKRKAWNSSKDICWSGGDYSDNYPSVEEGNPLQGFGAYDAMIPSERRRVAWLHHGLEISEILHGEQGALIIASQLLSRLPTVESRLFASTQVFDEARHVEFFSRYLREITSEFHPPSTQLRALIEASISESRWDIKFLACQILIESLAMARFQELRHITQVPVLRAAIDYIAKDEARHVRFGTAILKEHIQGLDAVAREQRAEFVFESMLNMANAMNIPTRLADQMGWDKALLRQHLRIFRLRNPGIMRGRFRILAHNLDEIGLLTDRVKSRLASLADYS